jgi:uncharacterized membrane protein YGL010W
MTMSLCRTSVYNPHMPGGRTSEQWIAQYASSHTHPVNRLCHSLGIPLIVISLALAVAAIFYRPLWMIAAGLFVFGWLLQFIGHAFEHKPPEFFQDWRFLLVGVVGGGPRCAEEPKQNP